MKRMVTGVVVALMLTMAAGGAAYASGGVEIEAGGKVWLNTLKIEDSGFSDTSDMAILIGPAVSAKFSNNVFVDGSIMTTATKYKFSDSSSEGGRMDIDLAVGYSFMPNVGAYAGYRNTTFSGDFKSTTSGPLFGVRGSAPINAALSVYGDLAYLMFTDKPDGGSSESAPGFGIEAGVKYAFEKNLAGRLGYKMETTEGADSKSKATFSGLILDCMYKF